MKRKIIFAVFAAAIMLTVINPVEVYSAGDDEIYVEELRFENADIASVFAALAETGNRNIVLDRDVSGKTSIILKDMSWREALLAVLSANNLTAFEEMSVIKVMPKQKFEDQLKAIEAEEKALTRFKPKNYKVIPIHNATANEIKVSIDPLIAIEADKPTVDQRTNSLIFTTSDSLIALITPIIVQLDVEVQQVSIEVRMLSVESLALWEMGVNWQASKDGNSVRQRTFADDPTELEKKLLLGNISETISGLSLDAKIQSMVDENKVDIIAVPHITTLDNTAAEISSGKEIPIITFDEARNTVVELKEALTRLTVTPHILSEERVQLDIIAERTATEGFGLATIFTTELVQNTVVVTNGESAVIGGMRTKNQTRQFTGIPILQNIPLIGIFFRYTKLNTRESDLIIFLTPHIVE